MADRNSTSKARPGRNSALAAKKSASPRQAALIPTDDPAPAAIPEAIEEAIEEERARLMTAHTLLSCAAIAMEAQELSFKGTHYPTILELARDLVNESINKLDVVNLESAIGTEKPDEDEEEAEEALDVYPRGKYEVREPEFKYLS
jgi:hypothetical protein